MARSESFFDAELPADPSSSYRHVSTTNYNNYVEDEEDIGLDYGVEVNDENDDLGFGDDEEEDDLGLLPPGPPSRHFGNYEEEEEEDDEIGLNRMPPMPDEEDDIFGDPNTSTPAPQDPTINNDNVNYGMMNVPFTDFAKEVVYTVASKPIGYCNVHELREDLRKDTGLLPDYVVAHYGFPNFETFMKSEMMKDYVRLQIIEGKHCFLPQNCERFAHIRNEQEIERAATLLAQTREENEKLCRALLPENREATLKGRKLISELIYELGGQDNPVSWTSVQKKYKEKYNEELAGEALKRMFTRDKAIKILETLFNYELKLFQANLPGHFFLQLKMPYNDLLNYYETELQNHNEAKAQMKNVAGRALRPKGNYPKQPKVFPTGPLYPTFVPPPPPAQPTKKSLDVPTTGGQTNNVNNNVSTSNQPSLPTTSNAAPKKSKFDISPEEIGLSSTKKQSFTEMINDEEADIAEERKITVKYNRKGWEEESSVPAYEIGAGVGGSGTGGGGTAGGGMEKPSRLDTPINQNVNNGKNEVVEGEAVENDNKKKTRYTSRIVGQDFTDSEESGDDEDEIVSVKRPASEGQQNVISNQKSDGENLTSFVPQPVLPPATISSSTTFVPPPRLSGHRAGIHKFMQEKVEQKKMEGATTQQQPTPSSLKPKIKRYPVNYSSDEYDEDDNIFNEQQKPREKEKSVENIFGGGRVEQQGRGGISTNNNSTPMFNSSLPSQQQQQPQQQPTSSTRHLSTFSSSSINQQQQNNNASTFNSPQKNIKIDSEWLLVDKVEWLRNEANKQKMSHESRPDEGSFIFRKGNEVLVLTESDDKIRASKHCDGRIKWDAYFPKTEWKLFSITILGLVYSFMLRDANSIIVMKGNSDNVRLPRVSNKCKNFTPPYPICLTTHCGQDFLCFFTKKFAFSNHFLTPKPIEIDGVEYCCSEQFYMYMKAMYFDYHSLAKEIMLTNDPSTIKRLGNADTMRQRQANGAELKCRDFDHDKWRKVKRNVMLTGLRAKFEQNVQLFNMLIETEEALLIEASQTDTFWGIGCSLHGEEIKSIDNWKGSNQMGNLLMKLRTEFQYRCRANEFVLKKEEYEDDCF